MQVQVPATAGIAHDDRAAQADEQQPDEKIGGGPKAIRKMPPEEDDRAHHHAHAGGVTQRPRESETTGVEQAALARRQRRDGREMVRLERMSETQEQAEARQGEEVRAHGGPQSTRFYLKSHGQKCTVAANESRSAA